MKLTFWCLQELFICWQTPLFGWGTRNAIANAISLAPHDGTQQTLRIRLETRNSSGPQSFSLSQDKPNLSQHKVAQGSSMSIIQDYYISLYISIVVLHVENMRISLPIYRSASVPHRIFLFFIYYIHELCRVLSDHLERARDQDVVGTPPAVRLAKKNIKLWLLNVGGQDQITIPAP